MATGKRSREVIAVTKKKLEDNLKSQLRKVIKQNLIKKSKEPIRKKECLRNLRTGETTLGKTCGNFRPTDEETW